MWHSDPHHTILVPERDTRSIKTILVPERDTRSIHTILVSERDTQSINTILVSEHDTRSPNLILLVHQAFFYTKASSLTKRLYNQIMQHTIKHIEDFTILPNTYHSLLRVYYEIV